VGARTSGREAALQILFAVDAADHVPRQASSDFWREMPGDVEGRAYAEGLVTGVARHKADVDKSIAETAANWRVERMTGVDRNILRIGAFELMHEQDTPSEVIIDEAVELAKRYGGEDSAAFVNGVLDQLARAVRPVAESSR
jgi:transcription antitermination protein NusB